MSEASERIRLTVSLKKAHMLKTARGSAHYDIGKLVEHIQDIQILSGDRSVSIQVEIEKQQEAALREAVAGTCTVGPYRTFRRHI